MDARHLKQDVTHWASTPNGYGGYSFTGPNALKGRWEDKRELIRDSQGNEVVSQSIVYLSADIEPEDYLFLGTSTDPDPTTVPLATRVIQFDKTPDLRLVTYERKAYL